MTDGPPETPGPRSPTDDRLTQLIRELGDRAQEQWDEYPVLSTLKLLEDTHRDIEEWEGRHDPFVEGYRWAMFHVAEQYLVNSGEFPCQCPEDRPFPGMRRDGEWICQNCESHLAEPWELTGNDPWTE